MSLLKFILILFAVGVLILIAGFVIAGIVFCGSLYINWLKGHVKILTQKVHELTIMSNNVSADYCRKREESIRKRIDAKLAYEKAKEDDVTLWHKITNNYVIVSLLVAGIVAIMFICIALYVAKKGFVITPDNIVLTFVGILATFLVVTNYAQVVEIKKEYAEKLGELNNKINDTDIKNKDLLNAKDAFIKRQIRDTLEFVDLCMSKQDYELAKVIASADNKMLTVTIKFDNQEKDVRCTWNLNRGELQFMDNAKKAIVPIAVITKINAKAINDIEKISKIVNRLDSFSKLGTKQ